jgi:hypothetical protein
MAFEFGETDESNAFFDRNPGFWPVFEKLTAVANKCFGREVRCKSHLEDVVFSQGHTCRDEFLEIVFLAVNGYAGGASKILRGLYERGVTLAYIVENPDKANRFYRFSAIQAHRALKAALKLFSEEQFEKVVGRPGTVARIREWYEQVKPEFKTQSTWDIGLATIVQKVGDPYRQFYLNAYTIPTLRIHATMASGFDGRDREQEVSTQNRHRECDLTLYTATCIFILVMRLQSKIFSLGLETELETSEKEMEPWEAQLQAGQPIILFGQSEQSPHGQKDVYHQNHNEKNP